MVNMSIFKEFFLNRSKYNTDIIPRRVGYTKRGAKELFEENRRYPYYVIHCTTAGTGYFMYKGVEHKLYAGDIFIFPGGEHVGYRSDDEDIWEYYWIALNGTSASRLDVTNDGTEYVCKTKKQDVFIDLFEKAEAGDLSVDYAISKIYEIFDEILPKDESPINKYVEKAVEYIGDALTQKLTLNDIAKRIGVSPDYLSKLIRQEFGIPFKTLLIGMKMDLAEKELVKGKTVGEVSEYLGFCDQFSFSNAYKKYKGIAPSKVIRSKS